MKRRISATILFVKILIIKIQYIKASGKIQQIIIIFAIFILQIYFLKRGRITSMFNQEKPLLKLYVDNLLKTGQISGKKYYCFGDWNIVNSSLGELLESCNIEAILDNNISFHGEYINNKKIVSPNILKKEEKGTFLVFILCNYVDEIKVQLEEMGLKEGEDFVDVYSPLISYIRAKMLRESILLFEQFIGRIPKNYFSSIPIIQKEKIGLVCICEMNRNLIVYSLTLGLLLRARGYKVTFIIDSLKAFESYHYFENIEEVARNYVDAILPKIKKLCPDIEIMDIMQEGKVEINFEDKAYVSKMAVYVLRWFKARYREGLFKSYEKQNQKAEEILSYTLSYIKGFFTKNKFDVLCVYTGFHRHRGMYFYVGEKNGMRVSTYDDGRRGRMLFCTNGIAAHHDDIAKMFQNNYFNKEEKNFFSFLGEKAFEKEKNSTIKDVGHHLQIVQYNNKLDLEQIYDIIIPLNLAWDAAALGRDNIFKDDMDWLRQTLRFIIDHTDASIMLREHPGQKKYNYYNYIDIPKELPIINLNKDRIFFVGAEDKINTYQYLERCKLVLPYTSTVGIEAAMMGKNVILHTDVYYDSAGIAYKALSIQDYFDAIKYYYNNPSEPICKRREDAYLTFFYRLNSGVLSEYCIHHTDWLKYSIEELLNLSGVLEKINAVGAGVPTIYSNIKKIIEKKE